MNMKRVRMTGYKCLRVFELFSHMFQKVSSCPTCYNILTVGVPVDVSMNVLIQPMRGKSVRLFDKTWYSFHKYLIVTLL